MCGASWSEAASEVSCRVEAAGRVRTSPGRRAPEAELLLDVLDGLGGLRDGLQRVLNHVDVAWLGV